MASDLRLSFKESHRSIKELPEVTLPSFAVVTGVNGSGKTHLLEAIENGHVVVAGIAPKMGLIRRFDWSSFVPQINEAASPAGLRQEREQALGNVFAQLNAAKINLSNHIKQLNIGGDPRLLLEDWAVNAPEREIEDAFIHCQRQQKPLSEAGAKSLTRTFLEQRRKITTQFGSQLAAYGSLGTVLARRAEESGASILSFSEEEIREYMPLTWTPSDTLQFQFAHWFAAWHAAWEYNKINRYYATQEGERERHYLSDDSYRKRFGPEPWEVTNRILQMAGVRYRFNRPKQTYQSLEQNFDLRLIDPVDQTEVKVVDLSSGEKALLAVTLLLYQATGDAGIARMPKVLLLDEVDAHLHPAYAKVLIDVLNNELGERCGISVLLTTHSPSTVALTPPGHVFELTRSPRLIRPISPSQAVQTLTSGFISVTPSDFVIITESSDDPTYYQAVQSALVRRNVLPPVPALKFVAASKISNDGEGGGCAQVKNWAPKLHGLGLERFRGLIDRDGGNTEDSVVKVLGRHSVENYLFDPLTIVAFLIHRGITCMLPSLKLERLNASELLKLDQPRLQSTTDEFLEWFADQVKTTAAASAPMMPCDYLGFPTVNLPQWWRDVRGHDLERKIREALNPVGDSQKLGALIRSDRSELIRFQTDVLPEVISRELADIFQRLQSS